MQAYKERFEYLTRLYSQNVSEEWKCIKFERDLRYKLLKALIHLNIKVFPELVEDALVAERMEES